MFIRKLVVISGLAAGLLAPGASFAGTATSKPPCILGNYQVKSVTPYSVGERTGKTVYTRLAGAQVFLEAQPGLTAEWLRLNLGRHLQAMQSGQSMPDCAFDMKDVRIQVEPAGTGFNVKFITNDAKEAKELLRRVELQLG